jgi:hypothetical protein
VIFPTTAKIARPKVKSGFPPLMADMNPSLDNGKLATFHLNKCYTIARASYRYTGTV